MVLHNRAPFEHIELNFADNGITVLSAINGGGKTTILSYIVDAWHEIVRIAFPLESKKNNDHYYRFCAAIFSLDTTKPSFVFIKFCFENKDIDYLDIRERVDQKEYEQIIPSGCGITFSTIDNALKQRGHIKYCSGVATTLKRIFENNLITSFPSYRQEQPGYLGDPFKIKFNYNVTTVFSDDLKNPIEVITNLPMIANWLMDVVLDHCLSKNNTCIHDIDSVFSETLSIKFGKLLTLCIGERMAGIARIQVCERDGDESIKHVYPTIFNMSSGENALICLFCEIIRQFDRIHLGVPIAKATGIVLVDEIDKHLHIRMQKDVLPKLMQLFPNIQFIISTHSPFVTMGLNENDVTRPRIQVVDLDNHDLVVDLSATSVFTEGYNAMIEKIEQYKNMYSAIKAKFDSTKLQIISEGYNGEHIKKAIEIIDNTLLDKIEFSISSDKTGCQQLKNAYDAIFPSNPRAKYLFVFDCDCEKTVRELKENTNFFNFVLPKNTINETVKKGIENLYPRELFEGDEYYSKGESTDDYGATTTFKKFDKKAFLEAIKKDNNVEHFEKFQPLIDKIRSIL